MDLFDLVAKLMLDSSEYEKGLDDAKSEADSTGGGIGAALGKGAKVAGVALGAATTAVTALATQSVKAYAETEQLEGGIETLFGAGGKSLEEYAADVGKTTNEVRAEYESLMKAQETAMQNASKAYASAGMSSNEYMQTVIGMAGALNKVTGDTQESAKLADMAIVDMSDNVNKMGTSMEMVQNAYTGFSRGNFTMLDNLSLGFAGTKEGMQELLDKAQEFSGIEYNIDSYADIVQAIHVVQENMGIAGTTAKEAMGTISGSFSMLQSSWENLVAGFGQEGADIGGLIDNVVESAGAVFENIQPVIGRVLEGIGSFIETAAPILAEELPKIIEQAAPVLLNAAANLILSLGQGLIQGLPALASSLMEVVTNIGNMISEAMPTLIPMIAEAITGIIEAVTNPEALTGLMEAGVGILQGIVEGILAAIPVFVEALPTIIENLMTALQEGLPMIIEGLITIVSMIAEQLPTIITSILEMLPQIIDMIVETLVSLLPVLVEGSIQLFMGIVEAIPQALPAIVEALPQIIESIVNGLTTLLPEIVNAGVELFVSLVENLPEAIVQIVEQLPQIITAIAQGLLKMAPKLIECGVNLMKGLADGVVKGAVAVLKAVAKVGKNIVDAFKKMFKINSPSKVFEEYGKFMDEGLAVGIEGSVDRVSQAMNDMRDATAAPFDDVADEWSTSTITNTTGATGAPVAAQTQVTAILELDRVQLGKVVFDLNNMETQRMGVNLATGGY